MALETLTKLASYVVPSGGVYTVDFQNIPQEYTDLKIMVNARVKPTLSYVSAGAFGVWFNGNVINSFYQPSGGWSSIRILSADSGFYSDTNWFDLGDWGDPSLSGSDNLYGSTEIYIPNYSSTSYKSFYVENSREANRTLTYSRYLAAATWQHHDPVTRITMGDPNGTDKWEEYSTVTLYGIKSYRASVGNSIKASGGNIVFDGTYVYHAFKSSGTFALNTSGLTADILVVGGGAGSSRGGGGAGGLLGFESQYLTDSSYSVVVGSGGSAGTNNNGKGGAGSNSQFGSLPISYGGGGSASEGSNSGVNTGNSGASGGGGWASYGYNGSGGSGIAGQGHDGGSGYQSYPSGRIPAYGGGGGGASFSGLNGDGSEVSGRGGNGSSAYSTWGYATGTGENVNGVCYFAGGGGGGLSHGSYDIVGQGAGGFGGGGTGGSNATPSFDGLINTGGGAGGNPPRYGGSGIVIVRYKA